MRTSETEFIIQKYNEVKALGWVKSNRKNNTGIGKTFEDYVGVVENNKDEADLAGFEIKSHRADCGSYVTLFTKSPNFPKKANGILKDKYGTPYEENPDLKKLHTSMFSNKFNSYGNKYSFKLINDRENEILKIGVYDLASHLLLDDTVGYTYKSLDSVLKKKLKNLFYVSAERRHVNNEEEFYFNHADIYTEPSLENFLDLIDKGLVMYDIRIGSYKTGKNIGKAHDHGSGFRILEPNIKLLYKYKESID